MARLYNPSNRKPVRSTVHRTIWGLVCLVLLLLVPELPSQQVPPLPPDVSNPRAEEPNSGVPPDIQKEMRKKANVQRQADLKRDTERLLKLSTELKEYVDKSNENILSLDVIKKADEIEKLAHSVKQKMRGEN